MRSSKKHKKSSISLLNKFSIEKITRKIEGYGYEYSLGKYMAHSAIALAAAIVMSIIFSLEISKVIILLIAVLAAFPAILLSQFAYLNNNDRFENIVNYLDQMIISFKQSPKILTALESTLDLVDGEMKRCVNEAIAIIINDSETVNVYEKAFKVIEKEFRCSRIATLHRFIINVERENSVNYQQSIDTLYFDIRSWVTRTYQYQKELKSVKSKIVLIIGISVGIAGVFTMLLGNAEEQLNKNYEIQILGSEIYQISTLIFFISFIGIYTFLNSKITGNWLINDLDNKKEKLIAGYIKKVNVDSKRKGFIPKPGMKRRKNAVEKELCKEFPVWLRDLAINLNHMVVIKAITNSLNYCSEIMKAFVSDFLKEVEKDPNSIRPYINFLGIYNVKELQTAFKTLYSIRMMSAEDSQRQINDLVSRNQQLLETSERIRNEDSISYVSFISMIPMLILSFKLICDLGIMLFAFLSLSKGVM